MFNVLFPLLLGFLSGYLLKDNYSYLETINRNLKVPSFVFIVVWTLLYILSGLYQYFYERDFPDDYKNEDVYYFSLLLNILFSPLLFLFHNHVLAFVDTLLLFVIVVYLFSNALSKDKKYAYLLLPYVIWLLIANVLMFDILISN